jgi:tRNA dimethylallyltransferase
MFEVPPDPVFRTALEKKSLEELTEILSTYRDIHNVTDIDSKKRAIRAIEIEYFNSNSGKRETQFPEIKPLVVGLMTDRLARRERITRRLKQRLENGMVAEVKTLLEGGLAPGDLIYYGLEYKYITLHLTGKLTYVEMFKKLETAIHQFAKRQMTWFRGMERRGIAIRWIDGELPLEEKVDLVLNLL